MAHHPTTIYTEDALDLFRYYKRLAERAIEQCSEEGLFTAVDAESSSIAVIVKHMREYAVPVDGFLDHGRRKTRPEPR